MFRKSTLDREIERVLGEMSKLSPDAIEYNDMAINLEKLYVAKGIKPAAPVSLDTVIVVIGSVIEIVMILNSEFLGGLASKAALGRVLKGKIF